MIHSINKLVKALVCAKSSKLITLEENISSVQQLPLFLPLFFVFFSEVLNKLLWRIKNCFDGVVFQDAICEECVIYVLGVFTFSVFCYCFYEGFMPKIILVSWFLLFICISCLNTIKYYTIWALILKIKLRHSNLLDFVSNSLYFV